MKKQNLELERQEWYLRGREAIHREVFEAYQERLKEVGAEARAMLAQKLETFEKEAKERYEEAKP